jgi:MarR family transcriptional regulator for hemolysin
MLLIRNMWLAMKGVLRSARQIIHARLEPLGLSGAEGDVLFLLLTGSDQLSQERLAEQLDVGKAAVSRTVDSLESKGYVTRERRSEDKRTYSVMLTEAALSVGADIVAIYDDLYDLIRSGIDDREFVHLESLLDHVAGNLRSKGEDHD